MIKCVMRAAVIALALFALTACGSSSSPPHSSSTAPSSPSAGAAAFYVSVGDSYAAGFQATARGQGHTTRNGFAYQVVTLDATRNLTLVNFGCAGATTVSALTKPGCRHDLLGPGARPYDGQTQVAAASAFLRAHRGRVGLITVILGGNDVTQCIGRSDAITCVAGAVGTIRTNLTKITTQLRAAAGPGVKIVGLTYPDVLLGDLLSKDANARSLATLSTTAFKSLINPALQAAYAAAKARFVDVTAATGGYGSLAATTKLPPYGTIPVPVAKICTLTFYCQYGDIHPRTTGYALIARLVVQAAG